MSITTKYWDWIANYFDEQEGSYKHLHIKVVEKAQKYLMMGDRVLDYGCATGTTTFEFAPQVKEILGIDFSPKMIEIAMMKASQQSIQNVDFWRATIFDPRLKESSFDVVLAFGILHLLKNPAKVIQRMYALLKPGGWFISSTACMGEVQTIPKMMNALLFIPGLIGIFPTLRFANIPKLEQAITRRNFQIVETETIPFDPAKTPTYIVGHFIAAKKGHGFD